MYNLDPNINTALERQAERVRAVRAYGTSPETERSTLASAVEDRGPSRRVRSRLAVALAAAVPIMLIVVVAAVVLIAR
jgi:hypothetical protein